MTYLQEHSGSILPIASLATALALVGCGGYTSNYVPLDDGRARAVYRDDQLVTEVGGGVPPECAAAIADPRSSGAGMYVETRSHSRVWVPIYYGPRIVVVNHGVAPAPHRSRYTPASPGISGLSSGGGGNISGGGSSGGSGGGDLKELAVVLVVVALIALPAITIGLALGRPEPEDEVAQVIDRVNLYNDMARTPGSPCALYALPAETGGAQ